MRARLALFIALAIALGAAALLLARRDHAGHHAAAIATAPPLPRILVAARDLAEGTLINAGDLRWQVWPASGIEAEFVTKERGRDNGFWGSVVRARIGAGQPVTAAMLAIPGERGFLAAVLAPGMRGISLPLNAILDHGGLLMPGDHIDLVLSHTVYDSAAADAPPHLIAETFAQNLRVVAIDDQLDDATRKPLAAKTVTLEVTPRQAEQIDLAEQMGALSLVLRAAGNDAAIPAAGPSWDFDVSPFLRRPRAITPHPAVITILRGNNAAGTSP